LKMVGNNIILNGFNKVKRKSIIVEAILIILILTDTILLLTVIFYDFPIQVIQTISGFDLFVCIILAIDYTNRMINTNNKKSFVKNNWIDIIAMLPDIVLNSLFSLLGLSGATGIVRLFRLVRVARVLVLFRKNISLFTNFIKETHLDKLLTIVVITIISSSVAFYLIEGTNFIDSIWYVLVTLTTVGYGDVLPNSTAGKIIGIILILIGILVFSTLTAAISSIYTKRIENKSKNELDERLGRIEDKLDKILNDK
jgi:voltage-gated potassium channel